MFLNRILFYNFNTKHAKLAIEHREDREHTMTNVPDFNSSTEKRARFGKVFSTRVEKLIEDLQAMSKTANLEIYEFDDELVKRLFIELAKRFRSTAHRFGIEFEISTDREPIE